MTPKEITEVVEMIELLRSLPPETRKNILLMLHGAVIATRRQIGEVK